MTLKVRILQFGGSNNFDKKCSKKIFKAIFVISGVHISFSLKSFYQIPLTWSKYYLWNLTSCSSITEGNTIFLLLDNIGKIVLPLEFVFLLLFIGWGIVPPWNLLPQSSTPISFSLFS